MKTRTSKFTKLGRKSTRMIKALNLGPRIRATRLAMGMNQRQAAERAEMTSSYLSQIELGAVTPTLGNLTRIAIALGRDFSMYMEPGPDAASPAAEPQQENTCQS